MPWCLSHPVPTPWTPSVWEPSWSVHLFPWTTLIQLYAQPWGLPFPHTVRCPLALFLWQLYTHASYVTGRLLYNYLFIHMCSSLAPEQLETSDHVVLRSESQAQCRIHPEGAINLGGWSNQQDCNKLFICLQSPISGSMNEGRSSWGHVDQQKLTDIFSCPSSSWSHSPLSSSSTWQTPLYVPAPVRRVFGVVNVCLEQTKWTGEGPGWPRSQPFQSACAVSRQSGCSRVRLSGT